MDISNYNCNPHNECEMKVDKQNETRNMDLSNLGVGSRLEHWPTSRIVETNKNARMDLCGSIIYGDVIDHMMLSEESSIRGDVRILCDLIGASRTNSATKLPFPTLGLRGRLVQTRPIEDKETYHTKKSNLVGGDEGEGGTTGDKQG